MDTRVRRVNNEKELHQYVDDYQIQGYSLKEHGPNFAKLKKSNFGSGGAHIVWFIFTFWWTIGLGNLFYALYAYFTQSQEIIIKVSNR